VHAKAPANRTFLFDIADRPTAETPTPSSAAAKALDAATLLTAWKLGSPVAHASDHKTLDPIASSSCAAATAATSPTSSGEGPSKDQVALSTESCRSAGADFYGSWRLLWPKSVLDATGTVGRVWEVRLQHVEYAN